MSNAPKRTKEVVALAIGVPVRKKAGVPDAVSENCPVLVPLVKNNRLIVEEVMVLEAMVTSCVVEVKVKLASAANEPALLYCICVVAPPGFVVPPLPHVPQPSPFGCVEDA